MRIYSLSGGSGGGVLELNKFCMDWVCFKASQVGNGVPPDSAIPGENSLFKANIATR